jgi:hypothetical protein
MVAANSTLVGEAFAEAARASLRGRVQKITHCVDQLSDEQVWQRPRPEMNSIANLLLHLTGNLRQWIVSGVGGSPDVRHRPSEFSDRSMKPKQELLKGFQAVVEQCDEVLAHLSPESLLETRRIQGFDVQVLAAIFDTIAHLQGHVQEIIHMTRAMKGNEYKFDFVPKGKEQGAAD